MESKKTIKKATEIKGNKAKKNDLLEMYREQTVNDGQHDYHIDGFYNDYSDGCCC